MDRRRTLGFLAILLVLRSGPLSGASWRRLSPAASPLRIVADPADASRLYVATGSGLFRSTDAGESFEPIQPWVDDRTPALAVDRSDFRRLFVGSGADLFSSTDAGSTWNRVLGFYRSKGLRFEISHVALGAGAAAPLWVDDGSLYLSYSIDRGLTWRSVQAPGSGSVFPSPVEPSTVYFLDVDHVAWRSTDNGTTWARLAPIEVPRALFPHPTDVKTLYAGTGGGGGVVAGGCRGLSRSVDGGQTWRLGNAGLGIDGFCPGMADLAFEPGKPTVLYGAADSGWQLPGGIFKSVDGGDSWQASGPGTWAQFGAVGIGGGSTRVVYAGGASGFYKSTDDGLSWREAGRGLHGGDTAIAFGKDSRVVMRQGGRTWRSGDLGVAWERAEQGLEVTDRYGSHLRSAASIGGDPRSGLFVLSAPDFNEPSPEIRKGDLLVSTDGGPWVTRGPLPVPPGAPSSYPVTLQPIREDWRGPGRFHGFFNRYQYDTGDGGTSWSVTGSMDGVPTSCYVRDVRTFRSEPSSVWVIGDDPGCLFKSVDGGIRFTSNSGNLPALMKSDAPILRPGADGTLWAGGFFGGLFRSTDGGSQWAAFPGPLPSGAGVAALATSPVSGPEVTVSSSEGLYRTVDGGVTWRNLGGGPLRAASSLEYSPDGAHLVATTRAGAYSFDLPTGAAREIRVVVPIVLDVTSGAARFRTELTLLNGAPADSTLEVRYTAALGSRRGSGVLAETLPVLRSGAQLVISDVLSWLRANGLAVPPSAEEPSQGGTLVVTFRGKDLEESAVSAIARTTSATSAPLPVGSAGLAYSALPVAAEPAGPLVVHGLRSSANDRSNVAVLNTGDVPVTVRVTVHSGSGDGRQVVHRASETLAPWGWTQYNSPELLDANGITNGWVTVERVSETGSFSCYGVVNDQVTNDGSFVPAATPASRGTRLLVPALVETDAFRSELVLTNRGDGPRTLDLLFHESLSSTPGQLLGSVTLKAREQLIIPDAVDYLRKQGTLPPKGSTALAGILEVVPQTGPISDVFAGSRTAATVASGSGGFGVFAAATTDWLEAEGEAIVPALRQDEESRSNVALFASVFGGPVGLRLQVHDGDDGGRPRASPVDVLLSTRRWAQIGDLLSRANVRNGWVRVTRTTGSAPWGAYGVVNDGSAPGQRTGDGAFIPMRR